MHKIDRSLFEKHIQEGELAWEGWEEWLGERKRTDNACLRHFLQLATGFSVSALNHYISGRRERLGGEKLKKLDALVLELGREDLTQSNRSSQPRVSVPTRNRRVALISELDVPSRAFHARITQALLKEALLNDAVVSIHESTPQRLQGTVRSLLETQQPHAVVMLRLTPNEHVLKTLGLRGNSYGSYTR